MICSAYDGIMCTYPSPYLQKPTPYKPFAALPTANGTSTLFGFFWVFFQEVILFLMSKSSSDVL